jgi:hypothetical protein
MVGTDHAGASLPKKTFKIIKIEVKGYKNYMFWLISGISKLYFADKQKIGVRNFYGN